MLRVIASLLVVLFSLGLTGPALADKRVALVIGNSAYEHVSRLANPRNDAEVISATLERLDFEVIKGLDLTNAEFLQKVRQFTKAIRGADIALLFYAGHGLQVGGRNYLAPVETQLLDESDLDFETISLDMIMRQMEREQRTNLVFLDACRNNPLARNLALSMGTRSASVGRGLAPVETGVGTLISYATQPGNVALDGDGKNSPFTTALVKHIETPGEDIAVILRRVRSEVIDITNGQQVPWGNSSLTGRVVLKEKPEETGPSPREQFEITFWQSIKDSNNKVYYDTYLSQFPEGKFAPIARLKIEEIEAAEAAHRQHLEAEREAEADRLAAIEAERQAEAQRAAQAEAETLRLAQEAEAARKAADEQRLAAEQRLAELEAIRKQREEEEARRAEELAAAEAARKAYEQRLAELEAQRAEQTEAQPPGETVELALLQQPEPETVPEPQIDPKEDRELVRSIQQELNRVGCSAGKADGLWGRKTERALGSFAQNGRIELATLEPSADLLDELRRHKARICPLVCGRGFEEKGGRCVRIPQTASVPAKPEQSRATQPAAQKPQSTTPQRTNSGARPDALAYSQRIVPRTHSSFLSLDTKYGTIHCKINITAQIRKCHWVE